MAKRLKKTVSAAAKTFNTMGQFSEKFGAIASMASNLAEQPSAKQVMESAQQIWLAGLGAFAKAQNEGKKVFDTLVKQGEKIEQNTRHVAEATIETAKEQVGKTISMATGKFDKLEQVFEERVHKSLNRLGVLTSKDVEALSEQVAGLAETVRALIAQRPTAAAKKTVAKKPVAKKPLAKKPAAKKPTSKRAVSRR